MAQLGELRAAPPARRLFVAALAVSFTAFPRVRRVLRELSQGVQVASGAVQADLPRLIQPREVAGAQPGWTTNRLQSAESPHEFV